MVSCTSRKEMCTQCLPKLQDPTKGQRTAPLFRPGPELVLAQACLVCFWQETLRLCFPCLSQHGHKEPAAGSFQAVALLSVSRRAVTAAAQCELQGQPAVAQLHVCKHTGHRLYFGCGELFVTAEANWGHSICGGQGWQLCKNCQRTAAWASHITVHPTHPGACPQPLLKPPVPVRKGLSPCPPCSWTAAALPVLGLPAPSPWTLPASPRKQDSDATCMFFSQAALPGRLPALELLLNK